ncbi:MAG: squalene/phytoene synthase family protein [Pseudomonadota bacterium]
MTSPASESLKEIHLRLDARIQSVDEPRWLSSRYAAPTKRITLIILYAFYYELARVRLVVTDETMGNIRFQWWRDALDELAEGKTRQHDVVLALAEEIEQAHLHVADLLPLIDQYEAAFLNHDRDAEPEDRLLLIAAKILDPEAELSPALKTLALDWAKLRRGNGVQDFASFQHVSTKFRPASAHFRVRRIWARKREPSALEMRMSILMAMITGRV